MYDEGGQLHALLEAGILCRMLTSEKVLKREREREMLLNKTFGTGQT